MTGKAFTYGRTAAAAGLSRVASLILMPFFGRTVPVGGLLVLDPLLERAQRVESIRAFAAAAMVHARRHEQSIRSVHLAGSTHRLQHAGVVVDAVVRGNAGIAPPVILQQLAAAGE